MKALFVFFMTFPAGALQAQVLATVGKNTITLEDFNRRLSEARKSSNPPTREEFLEDLIRLEIAAQEAEKMKLQDDPAVREQIKLLLYERLIMKKLGQQLEGLKVSEGELKQHYKKQPELRVAHIFIAGTDEARQKASEVLAEAKKPKRSFEALARQYSDDASTKEAGGDLGFQSRLTLPAALYDAALGMKPGDVKGPLETIGGFYILKLLDRRGYDLADKHLLRSAVLGERRSKIFDEYFDKTKKGYKVEINQEALKSATN
jgi:peptidyl-prolyl cis-trans isomerase C/peptidyl-prolyl cis-trans isomerase D